MTKTVTARLFDSYGNPWLLPNGQPFIALDMIICNEVHVPVRCGTGFGDLVFNRIHLDDHEAWYRLRS